MKPAAAAAVGGLVGLTWAAGFREYMAALAGRESEVTWFGTFAGVLAPATAVAAGTAASVPSIGGRRLSLTTPLGALTATLGAASVLTFALAASAPFRGRDLRDLRNTSAG
jgi:hypothetical protein